MVQFNDLLLALANPEAALAELDRIQSETSLIAFVRNHWHVLEPGREFVPGRALDAICEHLEAVSSGQIRKLLINVPPGCMKSLTTCVFWPAWQWGPRNRPDTRIVTASYAQELTIRDNRRCRNLIKSKEYQRNWGDRFRLVADQDAKVKYENDKTGFRIATSVGGVGTGERGDWVIIDDPHNVKEAESTLKREGCLQWFTEVVPTRINDPEKSSIIVIMQRVHERDVSGLILSNELGYEHLMLPMEYEPGHPYRAKTCIGFEDWRKEEGELLWPERFTNRYLEEDLKPSLRAWGGTYAEAGQLQQRPSPRGGGMFQRDWWDYVDAPPKKTTVRVRAWDLAATTNAGAYSAGLLMSRDENGRIYIEDVIRGQWSPDKVNRTILATAKLDGVGVAIDLPQDPGQAGKSQKSAFVRLLEGYIMHCTPETGSKEQRAAILAAQVEGSNVSLVRGAWNAEFVAEAATFPMGQYKDQIDASSRAYAHLLRKKTQTHSIVSPFSIGIE